MKFQITIEVEDSHIKSSQFTKSDAIDWVKTKIEDSFGTEILEALAIKLVPESSDAKH